MSLTIKNPVYVRGSENGWLLWKEVGVKRFYWNGVRIPVALYNLLRKRMEARRG